MQHIFTSATESDGADAGGDIKIDELAAMVRAKLEQNGLRLREASAETGISAATLSRVLNGKVPDTRTFATLVRWLGVSADLFITSSSTSSVPETIEAHLRADRTLPPELARALADLVRATYTTHMAQIPREPEPER